jgi:TolB-like protein
MEGPRYAFGPFVLDPEAGTLLRDGEPVSVSHRGLLLLAAFAERPGEVLAKSHLMDAGWPGQAVEESNLSVQIAALRKLFGTAPAGAEWIVTIPRVGYRFTVATTRIDGAHGTTPAQAQSAPAATKPSIAVLPFTTHGQEADQQAFADGLTEDLITDLSRNAGLFVIARHSSFAYRGSSAGVQSIADDLGVRYLLEGSARRAGDRLRINVQLVDSVGEGHVWAERFDRSVADIFAVQDELAAKIVEALAGRLTAPPPPRQRPHNPEAHDLCVRARALIEISPQDGREANLLLTRAIALDPTYAEAHRWFAMNRWMGWLHFGEPIEPNRRMAVEHAERAVALDPNDAACRRVLGNILAYERRWAESDAAFAAALELDPNNADAWADLSDISVLAGRSAEGLQHIERAFRLNPYPPTGYYWLLGQAQYAVRDYRAAIETLQREEIYRSATRRFLAASLAQAGRLDEARREAELFLVSNPHFRISHWVATQPLRNMATQEHFVDGYRKAGLPE